MNFKMMVFLIFTVVAAGSVSPVYSQNGVLGGDEKSACEAILCLSTGQPPHECANSLDIFFSIVRKKPWKTIQARKDFLALCPTGSADPGLDAHIGSLAEFSMYCSERNIYRYLYTYDYDEGGMSNSSIQSVAADVPQNCKGLMSPEYTDGGDFLPVRVMQWERVVCDSEFDNCFGDYYQPVYRWFYTRDMPTGWTIVYNPNSGERFANAACPVANTSILGGCREIAMNDTASDG